ncbi:MAG: RNA degradosome polyphosphate kinase, partial [Pseudomonadota bacterium]|nr:RNA degradosome polyphosphate kinase [Pseudomonadota bacterium]
MYKADFLEAPRPKPVKRPELDLTGPDRFLNRELSWLSFNWRVLEEAENPKVPLLERVRFLSISASNLDEFYNVRVAGLRELAMAGNTTAAADGLTPAQQLVKINENARELMQSQQRIFATLKEEMAREGIQILSRHDITDADRAYLKEAFLDQVFPVLSPLAIDPAHPFPFIANLGYCLALQLERGKNKKSLQAVLPIPAQIDRFVKLPTEGDGHRVLFLEELLLLHIDSLFPGYQVKDHFSFRVLRDSDLEVEEEAEDLVREFEVALKRRRRGEVVRLTVSAGAPEALKAIVMDELGVRDDEVIELD